MVTFISAAAGLLVFCLVVLAMGEKGTRQDLARKRVEGVLTEGRKSFALFDEDLNKPLYVRVVKPLLKSLGEKLAKRAPKGRLFPSSLAAKQTGKIKILLRQAGLSVSVEEYAVIRTFVIACTTLAAGLGCLLAGLGLRALLGALFGAYVGYAVLHLILKSRITTRRALMERQLPDVLDLLSVNVEAGLGFEQALLKVIGHFEGPLIEELTVSSREITMGRTRRDALTLLAERCELEDLKTFVGAIVQSEQLGISIKNILRTQSAAMRVSRRSKVEEKAQKVQVKMLFPMVGLIFPVLLIVLLGPALVQIIQTFKG